MIGKDLRNTFSWTDSYFYLFQKFQNFQIKSYLVHILCFWNPHLHTGALSLSGLRKLSKPLVLASFNPDGPLSLILYTIQPPVASVLLSVSPSAIAWMVETFTTEGTTAFITYNEVCKKISAGKSPHVTLQDVYLPLKKTPLLPRAPLRSGVITASSVQAAEKFQGWIEQARGSWRMLAWWQAGLGKSYQNESPLSLALKSSTRCHLLQISSSSCQIWLQGALFFRTAWGPITPSTLYEAYKEPSATPEFQAFAKEEKTFLAMLACDPTVSQTTATVAFH